MPRGGVLYIFARMNYGNIHIKHVCIFYMACETNNYDNMELVGIGLQEAGALIFNIICGSRLGSRDYYFNVNVNQTDSTYNIAKDPSLVSDTSLASTFVLLLTLIVFNGPFLNLWLVVVDYACIEDGFSRKKWYTFGVIVGSQIAAIFLAYFFINVMQNDWKSTITWPKTSTIEWTEHNAHYYWPTMIEELIAVTSLLMGFLYLAWLRPGHVESATPKIDVQFFLSLTLLVAACIRAFPNAHLAPHVSTYLLASGQITGWEWFWHVLGGVVGVLVVLYWNRLRMSYHRDQQVVFGLYEVNRVSASKNCVYQMAPMGAPSGSLSISFAKGGGYY